MANASLASQAVGPALSSAEMSYAGRSWAMMGKKMLALRPLAQQRVAPDDSILGAYAVAGDRGLQVASYRTLVETAFAPAYWASNQLVDANGAALGRSGPSSQAAEFAVEEYNFGLFWGLAMDAYESTLVANDSRVDQFFDGTTAALTAQEQQGLRLFQGRATHVVLHVHALVHHHVHELPCRRRIDARLFLRSGAKWGR